MKKQTEKKSEMRSEYDFSTGVRGKYAKRYDAGTNIVRLDADVAKIFPTQGAVNKALRHLADILRDQEIAPVK
ncbi:MAG: hypothetical protein ACR2H1_06890 [Limisphaerales bacterium]